MDTVFYFSLGHMDEAPDGARPPALIVVDRKTDKQLARIPYDEAARLLIKSLLG